MGNFKLLHTADWHIGITLEKQPLEDEHQFFAEQLLEIVKKEKPDALLVSGDVFDSSTPSNETHNWLIGQLKLLSQACPSMQLVVAAGNHDSANRLTIGHQLTSLINTHLVGRIGLNDVDHTADFTQQVIALKDANGNTQALLAAVPFVNQRSYPVVKNESLNHEQRKAAYYKGLSDYMAGLSTSDVPLLLMAHLTVATNGDADAPDEVGNIESVNTQLLGKAYDYVALGHLHHPHHTDGHNGKVNYSGSPIAVSFDEDFQHSVTVVELEGHNIVRQERIPISQRHRLVTIPKQKGKTPSFLTFAEAMKELKMYEGKDDYIRLNIFSKDLPTDYRSQAAAIAEEQGNKLLKFNYKHNTDSIQTGSTKLNVDQFRRLSPFDLTMRYLADSGNVLTDEAKDNLKKCIAELEEEEKNN